MRAWFFRIVYFFGIGDLILAINRSKNRLPILLFHRVHPEYEALSEPYTPAFFEEIIVFLKSKYEFISVQDLISNKYTKKSALVVFDDAMLDFYDFALPILKKHNIPTTQFVPTAYLSGNESIWNYRFFSIITNSSEQKIDVTIEDRKFCIDKSSPNYYQGLMQVHAKLLLLQKGEIFQLLNELEKEYGKGKIIGEVASISKIQSENWQELSYAAHTHNHLYLKNKSKEEIESELESNKDFLNQNIENTLNTVAYPNGGYDENTIQIAQKYFNSAFSVDETLVETTKLSNANYRFRIPRFNIHDKSKYEIFFRINGFHSFLAKFK